MFRSYIRDPYIILVAVLVCIGLALRLYNFHDQFIFGYDQARDAQRIYDIVYEHDIKIVGPESDIPGVFHGAFFYYLIAPVYALSHFDPNAVVIFLSVLNCLGIILMYVIGSQFYSKKIGLLAALFFAFSFEQANFSRFISNPTLMSVTTALFFYGIGAYIFQKKNWGLIVSGVAYALSVHLNFFLVYLIIFYPIFFLLYKPRFSWKSTLLTVGSILLILSPFAAAELLWGFAGTKSLLLFAAKQSEPMALIDQLTKYMDKLTESVYFSFFSFNNMLALFAFIGSVFVVKTHEKKKPETQFLFIWVFSTLPLFAFDSGVHNSRWINAQLTGSLCLLFSLALMHISEIYGKIVLVVGIIFVAASNLSLAYKDSFANVRLFSIQRILFKDLKDIMEYTHKSAQGKEYSICAVTNPLFINATWSFAYGLYGKNHFGSAPYWAGQPQYTTKNLLELDRKHVKTRYLIIEPDGGIPEMSKETMIYLEDHVSDIVEEKKFGHLVVQKRIQNPKKVFVDSQQLQPDRLNLVSKLPTFDPRYTCHIEY